MTSFPWIKQSDTMQRGAACLTMICKFYGINKSLSEVSSICIPTNSGISVKGIEESAKILGFRANSYLLSLTHLISITAPTILHWDQNHFVVLYKVDKTGKKFYIADPSKGLLKLSQEDFKKHWISSNLEETEVGVAMFLMPSPNLAPQFINTPSENRSLDRKSVV